VWGDKSHNPATGKKQPGPTKEKEVSVTSCVKNNNAMDKDDLDATYPGMDHVATGVFKGNVNLLVHVYLFLSS